jgi:hypothetical protein
MDFDQDSFGSFKEFFYNVDDEFLVKMILYDPKSIYRLCAFLSLDLQLEKEYLKNQIKKPN